MPVRLSTTVSKVSSMSNSTNSVLIREFYEFMKNNGASEKHMNMVRTKNSRLVHMLDTTYHLNYPGVQMTSDIFYQGNLQAPQEVMDRRLVVDGGDSSSLHYLSNQKLREAINPENHLVYVGVSGNETEYDLSYDNHVQAMTVSDLCTDFISLGVSLL